MGEDGLNATSPIITHLYDSIFWTMPKKAHSAECLAGIGKPPAKVSYYISSWWNAKSLFLDSEI
jgi:hypothetical protein